MAFLNIPKEADEENQFLKENFFLKLECLNPGYKTDRIRWHCKPKKLVFLMFGFNPSARERCAVWRGGSMLQEILF